MTYRATSRATLAIAAALSLTGCVGALLGGGKPDTLYRFGPVAAGTVPQATPAPRRTLALPVPQFSPATAGDRILTTQGSEISYIKGVRWVSPAPTLYAAALDATVATRAPDIAVATRASGAATAILTVSVNRFEASYPGAGAGAPVIHVDGVAFLADRATNTIVGRLQFSGTAPATADTGPAIAAAFDAATMQSVTQIVDWANVTIPVASR
ncbi:cholesterol transport system auxiliary component [Sphingomonas sp. PP-CE-3A-406]|uniref:ABC-type transport auxiliary lipoprotein family protein n=1 Tax=unclassified Sphingomonas TaxID=196159 RepID=UPI0009ECA4EC|nr:MULTISPECIES: ABC-type transport auxiliary lipoprotein family protein [unclassified Sphingomonas]RMB36647.1 cholesterol transport system auxiliary component [Sphingomonas sp. PP-F2F-G114-C0414]RMB54642.1 cholesterol transport system auxiliary component [Sphingomonas sp. PP-CE-3A-406]